jgi:hypothetical protein
MATHDYVIDNQTAPNFRADLNNALQAIVTTNSNATAPSVTYANMLWYETDTNILWKRNEDNSGWISLGTFDEANSKFEPNQTFASQAEAQAGTNNTKAMTALRTAEAITALVPPAESMTLLGTLNTTSGTTQTLSGLDLTGYKHLVCAVNSVRCSGTGRRLKLNGNFVSSDVQSAVFFVGLVEVSLTTGVFEGCVTSYTVSADQSIARSTVPLVSKGTLTTASTSIEFSWDGSFNFTAGSILVYGVK